MNNTLLVDEIFMSIQCEGPLTGEPALFIRLGGCSMGCSFCDTPQESDEFTEMTVDEACVLAVRRTSDSVISLVVITGGEPLEQGECGGLIESLVVAGFRVQVETNGAHKLPYISEKVMYVCSPKTGAVHNSVQRHCEYFKYTVDIEDYLCMETGIPEMYAKPLNDQVVYIGARDNENTAANNILAVRQCIRYGYKLNVQIHKLIGIK